VLYCDLIHTIEKLPDEKAGELFKIILNYVNDNNPIVEDLLLSVTFEPIKQQLKRDLKHYESVKKTRSENGKKGGRPKKQTKAKKPNALFEKQTKAKKAVIVKDTVTVIVKDKDIINQEFDLFWDTYKKKTGKDKCFKKFMSLTNSEREQIKQKLPTYIRSTPDVKFRKDPYKWLNGKHWEDEIEVKAKKQSTTPYASPII